jgi:hypothetical protein
MKRMFSKIPVELGTNHWTGSPPNTACFLLSLSAELAQGVDVAALFPDAIIPDCYF